MTKTGLKIGLAAGVVVAVIGLFVLIAAHGTSRFCGAMLQRGENPRMVEFKCETCGADGSIVKGFGEVHEGSPCGYISGEGRRCGGTYKVTERAMTPTEEAEHEKGRKSWESFKAKAGFVFWLGLFLLITAIGGAGVCAGLLLQDRSPVHPPTKQG